MTDDEGGRGYHRRPKPAAIGQPPPLGGKKPRLSQGRLPVRLGADGSSEETGIHLALVRGLPGCAQQVGPEDRFGITSQVADFVVQVQYPLFPGAAARGGIDGQLLSYRPGSRCSPFQGERSQFPDSLGHFIDGLGIAGGLRGRNPLQPAAPFLQTVLTRQSTSRRAPGDRFIG